MSRLPSLSKRVLPMLRPRMFGLSVVLGLLATVLFAALSTESAHAAFRCGSNHATYGVRSLTRGERGLGVRCVKWISNSYFIWYGEGVWFGSGVRYRHIGQHTGELGMAADIHGNGEDTNGVFVNLVISPSRETFPRFFPRRVRVTGDWNEEWILQTDGRVDKYVSTLPSVRTCGDNFTGQSSLIEYRVADASGRRRGQGVRCYNAGAWYGEGNWGDTTYAHIGAVRQDQSSNGLRAGAFDICERSKFSACNFFNWRSITLSAGRTPIQVRGAWNENWTPVLK